MKDLNLADNKFSQEGGKAISKLLSYQTQISNLDLSHNKIGNDGFKSILHAIRKNTIIKELILVNCGIEINIIEKW